MNEMTTDDVYNMFYGLYECYNDNPDGIWNPCVPSGNQITNEEHDLLKRSAQRRVEDSYKQSIRMDFHTCSSEDFFVFCNTMHINVDNDTYGVERNNSKYYENFKRKLKFLNRGSVFDKFLHSYKYKFHYDEIPRKHKYIILENGVEHIKEEYIGLNLTENEIKEIEDALKKYKR